MQKELWLKDLQQQRQQPGQRLCNQWRSQSWKQRRALSALKSALA